MSLDTPSKKQLLEFIHEKKLNVTLREGWENFSKNLYAPESLVIDVLDTRSAILLNEKIQEINATKSPEDRISMRNAAGGRTDLNHPEHSQSYSFSPVAKADIIMRLNGEEHCQVKPTADPQVMKVGAGVMIGELNKILYEQHGLVLPTSSLIPWVTLVGLLSTGGHGSGKDQPSIAGLIKGITFLLPNGKIVEINENDPEFETIRGANLGLFGTILSVKIKCNPAMKLKHTTKVMSLPEFLEKAESLYNKYPYVNTLYTPTYKNDLHNREIFNVAVHCLEPVPLSTKDKNNHPTYLHYLQELQAQIQNQFQVTDFLSQAPQLIPHFMRLVARTAVGTKDKVTIGPWFDVNPFQSAFPWEINDIDCIFPVGLDCQEVCQAFIKLATLTQRRAEQGLFDVTYSAFARVFAGTNGGLSTSVHPEGKRVCGFDIVSSPGLRDFETFRNEMTEFFINDLKAKPHWGKHVPDLDYEKVYGAAFHEFKDTWMKWQEKHGLDPLRSPYLTEFFCKILKMPEAYWPRNAMANQSPVAPQKKVPLATMAQEICKHLGCTDHKGKKLLRRVHAVATTANTPAQQGMFAKKTAAAQDQEFAEQPENGKKKGCCVLM